MRNAMRVFLWVTVVFVAFAHTAFAQEGGRQIRLDANTCKNIMPEYLRKKSNPLYTKALAAQKSGHANDMQKYRIREVEFLRDTVKFAKCKGV
jgi:hypothetical protein